MTLTGLGSRNAVERMHKEVEIKPMREPIGVAIPQFTAQLRQLLRAGDFNKNNRRVFNCPKGYRVSMRRRKGSHSRVECYDSLEDLVCC
jgi:hypothetical protein